MYVAVLFIFAVAFLRETSAHGMMIDPPSRSSIWRRVSAAPANYKDNEVNCGGFESCLHFGKTIDVDSSGIKSSLVFDWDPLSCLHLPETITMLVNGGCGVCGDNLASPRPRANENTGIFGSTGIAAEYQSGQVIDASITITANHQGSFQYSLCDNGDASAPETGEECFQPLILEDGSERFVLREGVYSVLNRVKLPDGFTCENCVLRWHWTVGNSWGVCEDGSGALGCGDQETFRSCADIRIV